MECYATDMGGQYFLFFCRSLFCPAWLTALMQALLRRACNTRQSVKQGKINSCKKIKNTAPPYPWRNIPLLRFELNIIFLLLKIEALYIIRYLHKAYNQAIGNKFAILVNWIHIEVFWNIVFEVKIK